MKIKVRLLRDSWVRGTPIQEGNEIDLDLADAAVLIQLDKAELAGDLDELRSELQSILNRKGEGLQQDARIVLTHLEKLQDEKIQGE